MTINNMYKQQYIAILTFIMCTLLLLYVSCLNNGVALTPPMGWSSWNTFYCDYNESDLKEVAEKMVKSGMLAAGYEYFNIDDCWEHSERINGKLTYNSTKFPSGLQHFSDYIHSLGLKFGLYSSSGSYTCQMYPGSWNYEEIDAETFAEWNVDFLKLDCCYQQSLLERARAFQKMSIALNHTNRKIVYSCDSDELILREDNAEYPFLWGPQYCNMARIAQDIQDNWISTLNIIDSANNIQMYNKQGYWNDLDILTVGMGKQTFEEYRTHFSFWSLLSSPLIAGNDLRVMPEEIRQLLTNKYAIAVNQDPLHKTGNILRRSQNGDYEIWGKAIHQNTFKKQQNTMEQPLYDLYHDTTFSSDITINGNDSINVYTEVPPPAIYHPVWPYHAIILFNRGSSPLDITLQLTDLFGNIHSPAEPLPEFEAIIKNVWTNDQGKVYKHSYTAKQLKSHHVVFLTVRLIDPASHILVKE